MQEERKRILKMVEEGSLKVDEALVLLEELEKQSKSMEQKEQQIIHELSTAMKFEEAKKEDYSGNHKVHSAKDKIFEFIDTAIKKVKDLDLDLNFGKSVEISHIFQQGDAYLKELDIDLANGSVKLIPWDQNDVRVECHAKVYRVETTDEARNTFLKDVTFAIESQKLRFSSQQKWMKVDASVYIPQTQYENIRVRMFNGSIDSENLLTHRYKVKTANGKININGIKSSSVEAETANGQISVRNGKVDDFEAETINGAIKVDGDFRKVDLQSFNGNIVCSVNNERINLIEAKATTGSVNLYIPEKSTISGELKSNLGGFNLDVEGIQVVEEKSEVVQKFMRFKPLYETESTTRVLCDTKTGSITVKRVKAQ